MDSVEACQRAVDQAQAMIASVRPEQLSAATPCPDWQVRELIDHMIGVCSTFGAALAAAAGADPASASGSAPGERDRAGDDPAAAYAAAAAAMMEQWRAPGALERTVRLPLGEAPAARVAGILVGDQILHTWDLAKALGRPYRLDEDLSAATLEMMQTILKPEFRGPGKAFGAEIPCPADAPVQARLLAFSGRQP
jgi:uncharacterized protein (TIGR03086 family)